MKKWFKSNHNIWSLLRRNISVGQLGGYVMSNVIGLTVVLAGIMFFIDSNSSDPDQDQFFSDDYLVISKKVDGIGFQPVTFDQADIDKIEQQPWAKKVGEFTPSQYAVKGSVGMGGRELSTYMFFESVPDDFFDVKPRGWRFDPKNKFVPIIVSKDYLTLYNFGFAIPQGMPQVGEEMVGLVPIELEITGQGQMPETFNARIVGFSSRLNTIAVPQEFMDWANARFSGDKAQRDPSRLIVKVDRLAGGDDIDAFFASQDIEVAGDQSAQGNISKFLSTASVVVTTNGLLISILAVFILILSIFLLLQKSKEKIRYLMLLGYSPAEISSYYERIVVGVNIGVTIVATALAMVFRGIWAGPLAEIGIGSDSASPIVIAAIAYLLIVTAINITVIRRYLMKIWSNG